MTKHDIIEKVASEADISKRAAEQAFGTILESIRQTVRRGKRLNIVGFGSFSPSKRKARLGRNPKTGAPLKIPAAKSVRFSPGKAFKDLLNGR